MVAKLESTTKRYAFGCGKKFHINVISSEGHSACTLIGEKNGTCSAVMAGVIVDLVNACIAHNVPTRLIAEIMKGHRCKEGVVGFNSCVDRIARDMLKIEDEKDAENVHK